MNFYKILNSPIHVQENAYKSLNFNTFIFEKLVASFANTDKISYVTHN